MAFQVGQLVAMNRERKNITKGAVGSVSKLSASGLSAWVSFGGSGETLFRIQSMTALAEGSRVQYTCSQEPGLGFRPGKGQIGTLCEPLHSLSADAVSFKFVRVRFEDDPARDCVLVTADCLIRV